MPILMLCPISPGSWSQRPSHRGPSRQRSSPSNRRSTRNAAASLPGPRVKSRSRSIWRFRCMIGMPSRGSSALMRTPAPIPAISLDRQLRTRERCMATLMPA